MMVLDKSWAEWRRAMMFPEQVRESFAYLPSLWGLQVVREDVTLVRFESATTFVQIYHGRISCEIGLELGHCSAPEHSIGLGTILAFHSAEPKWGYHLPAVREAAAVGRVLRSISELFERYAEGVARGDTGTFRLMVSLHEERMAEYWSGFDRRAARSLAEPAFRRRDYQTVVDAYSKIEASLSPAEKKKLDYARRRVSK